MFFQKESLSCHVVHQKWERGNVWQAWLSPVVVVPLCTFFFWEGLVCHGRLLRGACCPFNEFPCRDVLFCLSVLVTARHFSHLRSILEYSLSI
ncbi:hypothetical protein P153DRAFT_70724 [Dothidotthia symphoricarpi CBS 119687]|uniref:Uncharacterized protein n=1 Tax=Dothidotthia symphoricarpi CBS 119687 TaxID=1392245 RepID=A0A6A6A6P5_9PLEO|nr:uncharacterized protein P153DRAFT_70724 [Dothidotthia symphoricarpi CBS 119687]KAF2126813.1 hypothetical protein P153DRAFT_70724 [Dothidotthia symphoricarpi CBS 119687]